jgi:hypothetical protein
MIDDYNTKTKVSIDWTYCVVLPKTSISPEVGIYQSGAWKIEYIKRAWFIFHHDMLLSSQRTLGYRDVSQAKQWLTRHIKAYNKGVL